MKLVLAEKPSVGKELARILNAKQKALGAFLGNGYVVTWALGHLVTLAAPEQYNKAWENWTLEALPMLPNPFKTTVIKETGKQFNIVKTWLRNNDVKEIIIATDAGREGELVARWIIKEANVRKPMYRLWISSMTDSAIKTGFQNLKKASLYDNLYYSAEARSIADWLIGINVTRALTCKYNAQLSAGRVQTPTLAMIVEREKEIRAFVPKTYYQIVLQAKGVRFQLEENGQAKRFFEEAKAKELLNQLSSGTVKVANVESVRKKEVPPLLYDLTELQRDASRLYGMSPKETLDVMQRLYEYHKVLTYPRTDSRYLTTDIYGSLRSRFLPLQNGPYGKVVKELLGKPFRQSKRVFNNEEVSDHHAIIPTETVPKLYDFSPKEEKIYNLVCKRFISVFMDDVEFMQTTVTLSSGKHSFLARGKTIIQMGWKAINQGEDAPEPTLPEFKIGETINNPKFELITGKTEPPARYTEATLLSAMEDAGKFVDSKILKEALTKVSGIGTPATRAEIIERLYEVGYMELKGKSIYPTSKGEQLISLVPEPLTSPALTATWELRLEKIASGKESKDDFIKSMAQNAKELVAQVIAQTKTYRHDNMTKAKCPECGKPLLEINKPKVQLLVCSDRNCKYRKTLSVTTDIRCPNCMKRMNMVGSDDKKFYVCVCGYKVNTETFHEKLKENKDNMNKREVERYLRSQEIPSNQPFLDIFDKFKNS
ncbi:MAG TPA: DNA topoisomerase 3 [Bacilli bacterium]|jgi:DNA topoisomerase-3|nr:DNA topoisomerase 3 [Acholeplasmataceae bacterium]OQB62176.1 MAG: DNA topoisomerase 3 [Tenericutes bacterium ADurb.Bin140]HOE77439.1 DNA topoisomerase 3 [Bacilli bacterium]HPD12949.1 DNA topoisomerase 3 [Bacilli bacterium]HPK58721.1 DNA topoisomerase 3 [Bacilli bacterium]